MSKRNRLHRLRPSVGTAFCLAAAVAAAALAVAAAALTIAPAALTIAPAALQRRINLRQSVEQWRDVHGRQSRAVHLLHNKPDPVRYLYHRADQLPDLVQHVPLTTAYFPLAAALAIAAASAATNRRCMHGDVQLRLRRRLRRRRPRR